MTFGGPGATYSFPAAFGVAQTRRFATASKRGDSAIFVASQIGVSLKPIILGLAVGLALMGGWMGWRSPRSPNWRVMPSFLVWVWAGDIEQGRGGGGTNSARV